MELDGKKIIQVDIEKEMKKSYLDYSMSVIVGRALPRCHFPGNAGPAALFPSRQRDVFFHNKPLFPLFRFGGRASLRLLQTDAGYHCQHNHEPASKKEILPRKAHIRIEQVGNDEGNPNENEEHRGFRPCN